MSNAFPGKPIGAGGSSFELIDQPAFFRALGIRVGEAFLDLACGRGLYTLAAATRVGEAGHLYALDLWEEGIQDLLREARARGLANLKAWVRDITQGIPLGDGTVDAALMATVLHDFVEIKADAVAVREIARVLKPGGRLAVVEFKKVEPPPGPPATVRLEPEAVSTIVRPHGFRMDRHLDLGPFHYLMTFVREIS
jgi:ubiquinone/menaquinone biosynthesis C-methylase UbiE